MENAESLDDCRYKFFTKTKLRYNTRWGEDVRLSRCHSGGQDESGGFNAEAVLKPQHRILVEQFRSDQLGQFAFVLNRGG
ncbi:hypothetical protein [Rubripirellula reticaptiva]|uniref:hypothetical protein n=1 Tax=Rubripirellula reticaptiva TaxID=2528013 RepID=UPI0011B84C35|nr:hypothetical protein [Rubripirellula reticaptiva]